MTKAEFQIIGQLLQLAADDFENHGSNDFELPNDPENRVFMERAELWNAGPNGEPMPLRISQDGSTIYTQDCFLMDYLSYLAIKESEVTP